MLRTERIPYSESRRRSEKAASYIEKYERQLHKRISMWREKRLLKEILEVAGRQERLLDVAAGSGRLADVLRRFAEAIYEVDYSMAMLKLCRANARCHRPLLAAASAFQLPFPDRDRKSVV